MKLKYLGELASIVVGIDENKSIPDKTIVILTDYAIHLIERMKLLGFDVGALQEIFVGIQFKCGDRPELGELIDMAHDEIARLLGRSAWMVYGFDEITNKEVVLKVAA